MAKVYNVTNTIPFTYIDVGNRPVQGTKVYFTMLRYNEGGEIDVPDYNDTPFVNKRIMEVIAARDRLAELGG